MAWHWAGDKPLLEPMMAQFTDADTLRPPGLDEDDYISQFGDATTMS